MEKPEQNETSQVNRKRKCGPRVKTGCITCRIRRVKCDEAKPACQKCTSTGRKCDGYVQRQQKPVSTALTVSLPDEDSQQLTSLSIAQPVSLLAPGTKQENQLFHFYCIQSGFDLSVYLNSTFWQNMILQYSQHHPVVRQAVVAFGAAHVYAIKLNQGKPGSVEEMNESYELASHYDKALRALRQHIETSERPDPQVILICCALFFSCENGRGNREAALKHLEQGLHIINNTRRRQIAHSASDSTPTNLRPKDAEIDDELLYVFSRLDCQATLCQDTRIPVLDMDSLDPQFVWAHIKFSSVTDAQRSLDALHNRLARFLTSAIPFRQEDAASLPQWVVEQKTTLDQNCIAWLDSMRVFISEQSPGVKKALKLKTMNARRNDAESSLAVQIQLLNLHHRCWWMLFLSSYPDDPTVFSMSPNPRAEEILDICEFLGFAMPVRPSVTQTLSEADVSWKLISEVGITAPLFVLATKCRDPNVRDRAMKQLNALREYRSGVHDQAFLARIFDAIEHQSGEPSAPESQWRFAEGHIETHLPLDQDTNPFVHSPQSTSDSASSQFTKATTLDLASADESQELLGWSKNLHP